MKDEADVKHPRVMGEPVEAPPPSRALIPAGIPAEPMGSRIPSAARPVAMSRSLFDQPQARAVPVEPRPAIVVARPVAPVMGQQPRMGQPAGSAPVTVSDARDLVGHLDEALAAIAERPSADPGCLPAARRAAQIRESLRAFIAGAREGDTYYMGRDELAHLDKAFSCAILAKQAQEAGLSGASIGQASGPNTGAYVALGVAVAGMVVILALT